MLRLVFEISRVYANGTVRDLGKISSVGVGLREGEIDQLDHISSELGVSRNALMAWVLRRFLKDYKDEKVEVPVKVETKITIEDP